MKVSEKVYIQVSDKDNEHNDYYSQMKENKDIWQELITLLGYITNDLKKRPRSF